MIYFNNITGTTEICLSIRGDIIQDTLGSAYTYSINVHNTVNSNSGTTILDDVSPFYEAYSADTSVVLNPEFNCDYQLFNITLTSSATTSSNELYVIDKTGWNTFDIYVGTGTTQETRVCSGLLYVEPNNIYNETNSY